MITPQQKSNWCWVAVTYSLAQYYQVQKQACQSQYQIAKALLNFDCLCQETESCHKCNQAFFVAESLAYFDLLEEAIPASISEEQLLTSLAEKRPVVIATRWHSIGLGHLLTITAQHNSHEFVVWDSKKASPMYLSYENLVTDAQLKIRWVNTFLTQAPKEKTTLPTISNYLKQNTVVQDVAGLLSIGNQ